MDDFKIGDLVTWKSWKPSTLKEINAGDFLNSIFETIDEELANKWFGIVIELIYDHNSGDLYQLKVLGKSTFDHVHGKYVVSTSKKKGDFEESVMAITEIHVSNLIKYEK